MKIKLTYTQFTALYNLFTTIVMSDKPDTMSEKLVHTTMLRLYQKLYKLNIARKPKYNITLTAEEAIAFWLYWRDHSFTHSSFEGNLLTQTINSIDQKFA